MPDALSLLISDHNEVKGLFDQLRSKPGAGRTADLTREVVKELSVHAAIEEQGFYPAVAEEVPGAQSMVEEGLVEHQQVKELLADLDGMDPREDGFDAKLKVLMEDVVHHISEEEDELFPQVRAAMSPDQLEEIGGTLESLKKTAPTHPHPSAPTTPPGNVVAGTAAAVVDRARDALRDRGRG